MRKYCSRLDRYVDERDWPEENDYGPDFLRGVRTILFIFLGIFMLGSGVILILRLLGFDA
jgi:hypothetical protein